ncbi:MAG: phage terminase large subunit family protein [Piscinibacter sp.]|nr:phage terminase large subunit family protein [Piscinibacter sp.]
MRWFVDGQRPDEKVWVDEWAAKHRVLPPDTPEPGPYRPTRTPYVIDIQRTMSPASEYSEGWWKKPVQAGGSVSGENMIATWICAAAGSIFVIFPTLEDAKQWELARFEPLRAGTRELRRRVRAAEEKGSDNTKLRKKYPGGVMRLVGANKPIKSTTARYVKFEEPDDYPADVAGQGSLVDQARARTKNFGRRRKLYGDGTPTDENSEISKQAARGDQRHWLMHCPDCGHAQRLVWAQLRWVDGDPKSARYCCTECGALNDEQAWKLRNYAPRSPGMTEEQAGAAGLAHWVKTAQGQPGVASWTGFNALCLPLGWRPWPDLAQAWLDAQGDETKLKVFFNNELAEQYTMKVGVQVGADALQKRAERYELMTCPLGGLICCASVDTQDNRLAVLIRCWGRGEESWGVWYGEIWGDPSLPKVWQDLRALLETPIRHESGQQMFVDAAFIDAGGHHGEDVYAFCRDAQLRGKEWHAIRGAKDYYAPRLGKPRKVDFNWRGAEVPGGAVLRWLGTQSIKNLIDGRFKLEKPGGGYYHFPLGFSADYYKGLRIEKREWHRDRKGRKELWWINTPGNEPWDCEVYNYGAFLFCMQGQHAETVWRSREKVFGRVRQLDLLDDGAPIPVQTSAPPSDDAPAGDDSQAELEGTEPLAEAAARQPVPSQKFHKPPRPKRGGFVNRWRADARR